MGDNIKNRTTVLPCKCDGPLTCPQHRELVTDPYSFNMVEGLTIFEWLSEKRNCPGFFRELTLLLFCITIWCSTLITCAVKSVDYFQAENDENSLLNGIVMAIIAFLMAVVLWLWFIMFSSLWKRMKIVIRKNNNYLNAAHDINNAFAV